MAGYGPWPTSSPTGRPGSGNGGQTNGRRGRALAGRLHRYLGALVAGLVLLLAGSGLLLNHPGLLGAPSDRALSLAVDPTDSAHLLRGTRSGLHRSVDGGETWEEVPMLFPAEDAVDIAFQPGHPERVFVALRDLGLIRSTDGGIVWERVPIGFHPLAHGIRLERLGVGRDGTLLLWTSAGLYVGDPDGTGWRATGTRTATGRDLHAIVHQMHTGYFFSRWFYYLYDATSVGLGALVVSGLLIWRRSGRRRPAAGTRRRAMP